MAKKIDLWWEHDNLARQEFEYDLERCTTQKAEVELIDRYLNEYYDPCIVIESDYDDGGL